MTRRNLLIMQAEAFNNAKYGIENNQIHELMADFVIDRFNAFFDDARMNNNDEEVG